MTILRAGLAAAMLLPVAITATAAVAQTQERLVPLEKRSPEVRARLFDGRMAMIRESLKLDNAQLKLWAPVETQLRASFVARQQARAERRAERHARRQGGDPGALPDRLDRASKRAAERAERVKALADAFRPFYAALNDEQKAVAAVVLRPSWGARGFDGGRWHMRRASGPEQH